VDVSDVDTSVGLFGVEWEAPIILAPAASQQAFHPEGELAAARGARNERALQILSTLGSTSVEEVAEARGAPVWFQFNPTGRWDGTRQMLRRAEAAETPVVVLPWTFPREPRTASGWSGRSGWTHGTAASVMALRDETSMRLVLKGIVTAEDAERCLV
jgi:isopentenyl diphosphate isomerase/L-lactate dehydrogenase-like FMN-dependent dehydrogenase